MGKVVIVYLFNISQQILLIAGFHGYYKIITKSGGEIKKLKSDIKKIGLF